VLTTDRLILRPHTLGDFPAVASLWSDPEVVRHISSRPSTAEEAWARLLRYAGHWTLKGFGFWAVTTRDTETFVGELGFMDFRRNLEPTFGDAPEMGWALAPAYHGHGYALEAGRAALEWADGRPGFARTVCMISPENTPSIRLAERLGFRESERTSYMGDSVILFQRMSVGSS
jgi:RimJ/RimL family protein N-acetyltransferase